MGNSAFRISSLRHGLRPFRLHWFPRLRSTNDHAAELRRRGELFAPAVVLTGRQTAGRGRGDHAWWSGKGCLTVTFAMPVQDPAQGHRVPLIAGLAVRNAAAEVTGGDVRLKWPNDIVMVQPGSSPGKLLKLGGLLCERAYGVDLIGLGLNVSLDADLAPEALRGRVASLSQIAVRPVDLTETLITVGRHLRRALSTDSDATFADQLKEYDSYHALIGRSVGVVTHGAEPVFGRCEGLDAMGRLLLRSGPMLHRVIAGQVELR
jgi:BirA family biotin operon repressor/biotin-[acetyl-CoA-carboxylase] ligase